ncbi:MAG TPA: type II toxin-antitoxin system VapC family toxin [Phenylobacterium sp.]
MTDLILDSSAVLAWVHDEPGGAALEPMLRDAAISAVNLAEVVSKLIEQGYTPQQAISVVGTFPSLVEPFDEGLAVAAGLMRAETRRHGLSLGDRACLALARREELPAVTADRAWVQVEVGVEIRMLR